MNIIDRLLLTAFAVAILVGGYLAGHSTEEVKVPPPRSTTINVALPEDFTEQLSTSIAKGNCEGSGGSWTVKGTCVYSYPGD